MIIQKLLNPKQKKIETFFTDVENLKEKNRYKFNYCDLNNNSTRIVKEVPKKIEELLVSNLNYNLQLISLVIEQEFEIIQLQGFKKSESKKFLYEILYLGLKENFLEYSEVFPKIKIFYETGRITESQYNTLLNQLYIYNKEYEEEND